MFYHLLAQSEDRTGDRVQARRDMATYYTAIGALPAAEAQLRQAARDVARLRAFRRRSTCRSSRSGTSWTTSASCCSALRADQATFNRPRVLGSSARASIGRRRPPPARLRATIQLHCFEEPAQPLRQPPRCAGKAPVGKTGMTAVGRLVQQHLGRAIRRTEQRRLRKEGSLRAFSTSASAP